MKTLFFWIAFAGAFIIEALMNHYYLTANLDGIWLLYCSHALMQGQKYFYHFFETNPPLILYIYRPALWIHSLIPNIKSYPILVVLTNALIILSTLISRSLIHRTYANQKNHQWIIWLFPLAILYGLTCLTFNIITERDTLMLIFIMPYIFMTLAQVKNIRIKYKERASIALLAAIGLSIKPHFVVIWLSLEAFYIFKKRSLFSWIRLEFLIIAGFMLSYVMITWLAFPEYFHHIVPISLLLYQNAFQHLPKTVLVFKFFGGYILITLAMLVFYLSSKRGDQDTLELFSILICAFFIVCLMQSTVWYYHIFPTVLMTLMTFIFLFGFEVTHFCEKSSWPIFLRVTFMSFIVFLFTGEMVLAIFYNTPKFKHNELNQEIQLIHFVKRNHIHSGIKAFAITFVSTKFYYYQGIPITSRFPSTLLLPGIEALRYEGKIKEYQHYKNFYFDILLNELHQHRTNYIIISKRKILIYDTVHHAYQHLKTLSFLKSNKVFKQYFHQFQLCKNTKQYKVYARPGFSCY